MNRPSHNSPVPNASTASATAPVPLTRLGKYVVLAAAFLGCMFAGVEMSLFPLATGPIIKSFHQAAAPDDRDPSGGASAASETGVELMKDIGRWFTWYISAFLLGAAAGGLVFGWMGDRFGRVRAMGCSIVCYSVFTGIGYLAGSPLDLLLLRFVACMGIGGMWPAGVALVSEAWPSVSRPMLAGLIGTSANVGIALLGLLAGQVTITPDHWRWVMLVGAAPLVLGLIVLAGVPESPRWLAARQRQREGRDRPASVAEVFRPPFLWLTLVGICLGGLPLLGAWGASKWMLLWADNVGNRLPVPDPALKADTQMLWAIGAVIGSLAGGWLASLVGRRLTYFLVSLGSALAAGYLFRFCEPARNLAFLGPVFVLGLISTVYFGWLPLYLPELFPTRIRGTGSGVSFNFGRIASAIVILSSVALVEAYSGRYEEIGATTSLIYLLGCVVILLAPRKTAEHLED
jgi:SHS family sialic acid transporter-like MFS transporter